MRKLQAWRQSGLYFLSSFKCWKSFSFTEVWVLMGIFRNSENGRRLLKYSKQIVADLPMCLVLLRSSDSSEISFVTSESQFGTWTCFTSSHQPYGQFTVRVVIISIRASLNCFLKTGGESDLKGSKGSLTITLHISSSPALRLLPQSWRWLSFWIFQSK